MEELLALLKSNHIGIKVKEGNLTLDIPAGIRADNILKEIKARKSELIAYMSDLEKAKTAGSIGTAPAKEYYRLSAAQRRMYILHEYDRSSLAYNMLSVTELTGLLDVTKLSDVFNRLAARHESLRTAFVKVDGEPVQKILAPGPVQLSHFNAGAESIHKVIHSFRQPFDLSLGRLFRIGIINLGPERNLLLIDMHHIITDGVSESVWISDFVKMYNGESLPELKIHYKDYAEWQHDNDEKSGKDKKFWISQFTGDVPKITLPYDFERPALKGFDGSSFHFELTTEETTRLKGMARSEGVTIYMLLLSIYNLLLSKIGNTNDVVVGSPVAAREHADLDRVIGMFVNMLPIRSNVSGDLTFRQLLAHTKAKAVACFDHQFYQYEQIIEDLKLPRDIGRNALFDCTFELNNFGNSNGVSLTGLIIKPFELENTYSKFDLTLSCYELDGRLHFYYQYSTNLFRRETIERFAEYFKRLVTSVLNEPGKKLNEIRILSEMERLDLVSSNEPLYESISPQTVLDHFNKQVSLLGNKTAQLFEGKSLSYNELNARSERMAHYLQNKGVAKGDFVGVLLDREEYLLSTVLGILKSGCAYVPIDAQYPVGRVNAIIRDSKMKFLVTRSGLSKMDLEGIDIIDLDQDLSTILNSEGNFQSPGVAPSDLAYVIYTSGSTGTPKGVMIEHGSLENYLSWGRSQYVKSNDEVFALFTSISFDLTVTSMFLPLISGTTVAVYKEDDKRLTLENVLNENISTIVKLTPSHLRVLLDSNEYKESESVLRRLIIGGEDLKSSLAREAYERGNNKLELYNEYGPTETTVGCMIQAYNGNDTSSSVPIGYAINNMQVYVLDDKLEPVPLGSTGELYVSGRGVGRGYLGREGLTASKFLKSPFREGDRLYRTGDLAIRLSDGRLVYMGRIDDQVKLRGHRIELGEISESLKKYREQAEEAPTLIHDEEHFAQQGVQRCTHCLLTANYPGISFNAEGLCNVCEDFFKRQEFINGYFRERDELEEFFRNRPRSNSEFDCVLLFSGGKDSTYTLYRLLELNLKVLAFTFDNGFISKIAFENIRQSADKFKIKSVIRSSEHINRVLEESIRTKSNACTGCWNSINTLGVQIAQEYGIDTIVSGLSRGQIIEMRLEGLMDAGIKEEGEIEDNLKIFRQSFHSNENAFYKLLKADIDVQFLKKIQFIDYFRYDGVDTEGVKNYLLSQGWVQPKDTGLCSTNCVINDVGIYMHWKKKGFHFYEAPMSWDRRMNLIGREQTIHELTDRFNVRKIQTILKKIGYYDEVKINDAVVTVKEDNHGNSRLVGYYVSRRTVNEDLLREHLAKLLPEYMIPQHLVWLESMPLTQNGKVDKKALPEPQLSTNDSFYTSLSSTELRLIDVWAEVLNIDRAAIQPATTFFALGGNSILASRMLNILESRFSVSLELKDIFQNNTVDLLSKFIEGKVSGEVSRIPTAVKEPYFASSSQERLFYQQALDSTTVEYNVPGVLEIKAKASVEKITRTFEQLIDRHESLRTTFSLTEDGVLQEVLKQVPFALQIVDASKFRTVEQAYHDFIKPFDLSSAPLLRSALFTTSDARNFLFIDVHHIVCDGVSWAVLMNEFVKLYAGGKVEPLNLRYVDYAAWQRDNVRSLSKQKQYWTDKLSEDLPALSLPVSRENENVKGYRASKKVLRIDGVQHDKIRKLKSAENASDFMVLLSALYILLNKITGANDIIVGTDMLGRTHSSLKDIVGNFVNVLPLRVKFESETTAKDLIKLVKETVLEAYSHQDYPFEKIVSDLGGNNRSGNNLFKVHFSVDSPAAATSGFRQFGFEPVDISGHPMTDYEFKIRVVERSKRYDVQFIYANELFDEQFVSYASQLYSSILAAISDDTSTLIDEIRVEDVVCEEQ